MKEEQDLTKEIEGTETPKEEVSKKESSKKESSKKETSKKETSKKETSKKETEVPEVKEQADSKESEKKPEEASEKKTEASEPEEQADSKESEKEPETEGKPEEKAKADVSKAEAKADSKESEKEPETEGKPEEKAKADVSKAKTKSKSKKTRKKLKAEKAAKRKAEASKANEQADSKESETEPKAEEAAGKKAEASEAEAKAESKKSEKESKAKEASEEKKQAKEPEGQKAERKEALEAATLELEAAPYIIPKTAFKLPVWAKTCIIVTAVLAVIYGAGMLYFSGHFMWNSSLNGVDVSWLDAKQAQEKLETTAEYYELRILERDEEVETISGPDIHLKIEVSGNIQGVIQQQDAYMWFVQGFGQKNYTTASRVTYDVEELYTQIQELECMQAENMVEPVEPQIVRTLGVFSVQEGIEGKKPLSFQVRKTIREAISNLSDLVDLEAEHCYVELEYDAEDAEVLAAVEVLEKYQDIKIIYRFPNEDETLTGDDILKWVKISEDYEVTFDRKQVADYIESLLETYEVRGQVIHFQTTQKQTVEITSYLRSSELDQNEEAEALLAILEEAKDSNRREYVRKASDMASIGDTYIEINLTTQHLYCYKDGNMILETDMVSGRPSTGHATPPGIFTIRYTASPAILVGEDYRTPVSYWMPFNGGIGLHDATWQSSFGGSRYISNGSHGCINLPLNMAREIYNNYEAGDVVVVYHQPVSTATTSPVVRPSSAPVVPPSQPQESTTGATEAPATEAPASTTESAAEAPGESTEAATENQTGESEGSVEEMRESPEP